MTRTAGSDGPTTLQAIRRVGLDLIYEHGYEAMTLRKLAEGVGIQQGSLYNHFRNKQDLLFDLVRDHMVDLTENLDRALEGLTEPPARLDAFVGYHVKEHMERRKQVFVGNSELRALTEPNLARIVDLRSAYEARLTSIIEAGVAAGKFRVGDVRIATFAILSMLTGVCNWYRPRGRLKKDQIVEEHVGMARRLVAAASPP
jgi:AcrR family transcriptional regulator